MRPGVRADTGGPAWAEAVRPIYEWFKPNVGGGEGAFNTLTEAVALAGEEINAARAADIR
ncbi:hypothetical protein [Paracoccus alkanivorans]|uniref:Uncharacterized protein n=1 Tax=Paracoccus alkanivorans TaxID=2116655 RepID=A0A3M0MGJ1_9RHOB|nr:hypothetical protein [Paracoccus alkanivorans]RMC34760.1 hypothetical protein C9E81_11705 [Paracoccus alkanivorans]